MDQTFNDNSSQHENDNMNEEEEEENEDENETSLIEESVSDNSVNNSSLEHHFHFKQENGAVTYRVVSVGDIHAATGEHQTGQHIISGGQTAAATVMATQQPTIAHSNAVTQALIATQTPFAGSTDGQPFYVMMTTTSPQELMTSQAAAVVTHNRRSSGRHSTAIIENTRVMRDEKRRATHNEVERRRRDKINNWIIKLSKVVPDCASDHTKQGQSKGGILAKATEYIQELCLENSRMNEVMKENEILNNELDSMRSQYVDTKNENRRLKSLLQKNGIPFNTNNSDNNDNNNDYK